MLTDKQRLDYVMGNNSECPHCHCGSIDGGSFDCCGSTLSQKLTCTECNEQWSVGFSLYTIIDEDGDDDMATAKELRTALDKLLGVIDDLYANGQDLDDDERVTLARDTLAMGLEEPEEPSLLEAAKSVMDNARDLGDCFIDRDDERYDPENPQQMYPDWAALDAAIEREEDKD